MKILSGKYFRRNINVVGKTRPPLLRMRQALMDMLNVQDKNILDLCAGSGSFGLECLSRGAKFVYFVEQNFATANNLMNTLKDWRVENAKVIVKNIKYLPEAKIKVDLIFFDPPFGHDYTEYMKARLLQKNWCNQDTELVIRYNQELANLDSGWELKKIKRMGKSFIHFFKIQFCTNDKLVSWNNKE